MYKSLKMDRGLQIPVIMLSAVGEIFQHYLKMLNVKLMGAAARSRGLSGKTARCSAAAGNGNPAHGFEVRVRDGRENPAGR
jgi:hypothetical protein